MVSSNYGGPEMCVGLTCTKLYLFYLLLLLRPSLVPDLIIHIYFGGEVFSGNHLVVFSANVHWTVFCFLGLSDRILVADGT